MTTFIRSYLAALLNTCTIVHTVVYFGFDKNCLPYHSFWELQGYHEYKDTLASHLWKYFKAIPNSRKEKSVYVYCILYKLTKALKPTKMCKTIYYCFFAVSRIIAFPPVILFPSAVMGMARARGDIHTLGVVHWYACTCS